MTKEDLPVWAKGYTHLDQALFDMPYFLRQGKWAEAKILVEVVRLYELDKKYAEERERDTQAR